MSAIIGKQITEEHRSDGPMVPAGVRAREPFLYAVHPHKWPWDDAHGDHLPKLNRIPITKGCGGVDKDGNDALLRAGLEEHDYIVIRPSDQRLGKWANYTFSVPHAGGRKYIVSRFEVEGSGNVESIAGHLYVDKDQDLEREFKLFLLSQNIVPPLAMRLRRHFILQQRERVARIQGRAEAKDSAALRVKLKAAKKRLSKMEAARERAQGGPAEVASA